MRVIYGTSVNMVVNDQLRPEDMFDNLKATYPELVNGTWVMSTENGENVMRVSLRAGGKA